MMVVATALILFAIIMAFVVADTAKEADGGHVQRIMYFHVASAWISYVAFSVTLATSLVYIKTKDLKWDVPAFSSAQLGVVFCTLAITTGPMWAKAVWGVYWRWEDLKLLMTLVLWLIFIAYLVLRANVQSKRTKADLSAAFSILGFLCIPLSAAANRIWQQYHPTVVATDSGGLAPSMGAALGMSVLAFTFLYIALLAMRVDNENLKSTVEELKDRIGELDG
jgi:heme exporter protein C